MKFLQRWDDIKKSSWLIGGLVFILEIKSILETIWNLSKALVKGASWINWNEIIVLPNESIIDFITKVIIVWLFYSLTKSIKKIENNFNGKLENLTNNTDGAILHMQGSFFLSINQPYAGIQSLILAIFSCMKSGNFINAQNEIKTIITVLSNKIITKKHLSELKIDIEELSKTLTEMDTDKNLETQISELLLAYNNMTA